MFRCFLFHCFLFLLLGSVLILIMCFKNGLKRRHQRWLAAPAAILVVRHGTTWSDVVWRHTVACDVVRRRIAPCDVVKRPATSYNLVRRQAASHNILRPRTKSHDVVRSRMTSYAIVRPHATLQASLEFAQVVTNVCSRVLRPNLPLLELYKKNTMSRKVCSRICEYRDKTERWLFHSAPLRIHCEAAYPRNMTEPFRHLIAVG